MKVIFLDIDGVLNGFNNFYKFLNLIFGLNKKTKKFFNDHYDLFGIRTYKVFLLSLIVKMTGAKVVLSSSWKKGFNLPYDECNSRTKLLKDMFNKFNIEVIGITKSINGMYIGIEIKDYIDNNNVSSFVILDDEEFDIIELFSNNFVKTSDATTEDVLEGKLASIRSGLRLIDVFRSIKILRG